MGYVLTRPVSTTNPPDSWGRTQTTNCCSHCGSGIDAKDKTCIRCGAPNENYKQVVEKHETWGECIRQIENAEPAPFHYGNGLSDRIRALEEVRIAKIGCGLDLKGINKELEDVNNLLNNKNNELSLVENELLSLEYDNSSKVIRKQLELRDKKSKILEEIYQ